MAALPWIVIGIAVALAFVKFGKRKGKIDTQNKQSMDKTKSKSTDDEDNYMSMGMCFGMCIGTVLSSMGIVPISYGISFGMLIGMVIGMCIRKK